MTRLRFLLAALLFASVAGASPRAVETQQDEGTKNTLPKVLENVALKQAVGEKLPLELPFTDDKGHPTTLGAALGGKPALLAMVYYECPSLCGMVMGSVFRAMKESRLVANKDFRTVFVSINPKETTELAAGKKKAFVERYGFRDQADGIVFLTSTDASAKLLADRTGFQYRWDEATKQFAHPGMMVVVTPDGRINRYFAGVEYAGRDTRLALVEASQNKIGSVIDQFFLYCYRFDAHAGKYGLVIFRVLRIFGVLTILLIGFLVWFLSRGRGARQLGLGVK